jgi:hypothetical protein
MMNTLPNYIVTKEQTASVIIKVTDSRSCARLIMSRVNAKDIQEFYADVEDVDKFIRAVYAELRRLGRTGMYSISNSKRDNVKCFIAMKAQ